MKAIVYTKYGSPDVLELKEVDKPAVKDNEVLIKVHASTVSPMDWRFRKGKGFIVRLMSGIFKPRRGILGIDISGEIESVGKDVKLFKTGNQVYGVLKKGGGHAEYAATAENSPITLKPVNMSYEEAAAVPFGAISALVFLKKLGNIRSGQKVLINGASGGVGTFAVQLAKYFGAEVTAVCSTRNLDLAKSLGADEVIDYTKEDFTKTGHTYDIIFDAVGKSSFSKCKSSLNKRGIYLSTVLTFSLFFKMLWTKLIGNKKARFTIAKSKADALVFLKELIEAGEIKSVIDKSYPLSQTAEAHRYGEKGHVRGKLVVTI